MWVFATFIELNESKFLFCLGRTIAKTIARVPSGKGVSNWLLLLHKTQTVEALIRRGPPPNLVFRLCTPHNTGPITSTLYFSEETVRGDRRFLVSRLAGLQLGGQRSRARTNSWGPINTIHGGR